MKDWMADPRRSQVLDALASCVSTGSIEAIGANSWVLPLGHGGLVYAELDGDWLRLGTPGLGGAAGIEALERNARLSGFAKLAVDFVETPTVHARAELPLDEGDAFLRVLTPTLAGLASAGCQGSAVDTRDLADPCEESASTLRELCAAAGWPSEYRSDEHLSVDLGVAQVAPRAIVRRSGVSGAVRVSATFDPLPSPSAACRDAVARFLLRGASVLRMARPVAAVEGERIVVCFEVGFDGTPEVRQLGHALAALHVAVRRSAREVAALGTNDGLARAFLRLAGHEHEDGASRTQEPSPDAASTLAATA